MSITSTIFSPAPVAVVPAAVPAVPGAAPVAITPAAAPTSANPSLKTVVPSVTPIVTDKTASNGVVPADPNAAPAEPNLPKSPLDPFQDLWETPKIDPNKPKPEVIDLSLDPVKLKEIVSKANFAQNITPENIAAIQAGGDGAMAAFQETLNTVAQQTMLQSTLVANKLVEQAVAKMTLEQEAKIPELVRQSATNSSLVEANPLYSDPAVKPMVEMAQSQLAIKFPDATPAELTKMSKDFILAMGKAFNPEAAPNDPKIPEGENWEVFLAGNKSNSLF